MIVFATKSDCALKEMKIWSEHVQTGLEKHQYELIQWTFKYFCAPLSDIENPFTLSSIICGWHWKTLCPMISLTWTVWLRYKFEYDNTDDML